MRIHNVRDFPQAKLDSEINVCFLLNQNRDHIFLLRDLYTMTWHDFYTMFISEESPEIGQQQN